jgi:hypothetical protein
MLNFKFFLTEAVSNESKLTHLEHAEDHVINSGEKGFSHAFHNLKDVHDKLSGKHNNTTITSKYDGSPSIVFGHHPKTKKFFVGTKSVFNKDPKINHTNDDVDKNHGHAPALAHKLKHALKHLPKVTPKGKIYQADLMHHGVKSDTNKHGDVEHRHGKLHFKPNTISYSTHSHSDEGKKISKSKIGIVPHTEYKGHDLTSMKAHYNADVSKMHSHEHVHVISPHFDHKKVKYTEEHKKAFHKHLNAATKSFNNAHRDFHKHVEPHTTHLKTYINHTIRHDTKPNINGYKNHLSRHYNKKADAVKTDAAKQRHLNVLGQHHAHVDKHVNHFKSTLSMHHHLQHAKNTLVNALNSHTKYHHHIAGIKTKPEGYVVSRNNRPTKLVHRHEFSRANFLRQSS